eukprot:6479728-Amphidinium_carterae.1
MATLKEGPCGTQSCSSSSLPYGEAEQCYKIRCLFYAPHAQAVFTGICQGEEVGGVGGGKS